MRSRVDDANIYQGKDDQKWQIKKGQFRELGFVKPATEDAAWVKMES